MSTKKIHVQARDLQGAIEQQLRLGKAPLQCAEVAHTVRAHLPDVRAVRRGSRTVIIRHGQSLEARLVDDGRAFVITFSAGNTQTSMSSFVDSDRRDDYTQRDHMNISGGHALQSQSAALHSTRHISEFGLVAIPLGKLALESLDKVTMTRQLVVRHRR